MQTHIIRCGFHFYFSNLEPINSNLLCRVSVQNSIYTNLVIKFIDRIK